MQHAHGRRIITGISLDYRADGASKSFSATVRFGSEEPGCATERTFYRGADIIGIGKEDIHINNMNISCLASVF